MSTGTDANDNLKSDKPAPADSTHNDALINRVRDEQITTQEPNRSWLNQAVHSVVGTVVHNESAKRNQGEQYAVEFIKAVPLFVGGVWGKALSTVAFGADEVKCNDSASMQALELVSGAGKGLLTKTAFDYLGTRDWNFAAKGMAMGSSSRLLDTALTPGNYFNGNGNFDFSRGVEKAAINAGDGKALGIDALTFGAAHLVPGAFARTALQRSTTLMSGLTGASFGFASGSLGELQRQWHDGKGTNLLGVLESGGIEAGLMAGAAVTGHTLTPKSAPLFRTPQASETATKSDEQNQPEQATQPTPIEAQTPTLSATELPGSGVMKLGDVRRAAQLYLIDPERSGKWSLSATGVGASVADRTPLGVEPSIDPTRIATISTESLQSILGGQMNISADAARIAVTRRQVENMNFRLEPSQRLTTVKVEKANDVLAERMQTVLARYPDQSLAQKFQTMADSLPYKFRHHYVHHLEGAVNSDKTMSGVQGAAKMNSLLFEMSRMQRAVQQGLETVSDRPTTTESVRYFGFDRLPPGQPRDYFRRPMDPRSSRIEIDVPIIRENGLPYVHEVKTLTSMTYGRDSSHRNQILKYQSAIDQGLIDGATVEVSGRVSPQALEWLNGTSVGERGPAPDVELLYTMPLPSGADYTFVLKRAEHNRGLRYFNDDRNYTDEDRRIVAGIYKSIQDRSIGQLISDTHIEDPELRKLIKDPFYIQDADLMRRYNDERQATLNRKLVEKAADDQVNGEQPRDSTSEYNTRDYIETTIRGYQDHLQQKPDGSRSKQTYLLGSEQAIQNATDRADQRAQEIRAYEIARGNSPEEAERRAERARLGYVGPQQGVGLDMDHIILDSIHEENKTAARRGRVYDQPERFMDASQLQDYLGKQDRSTTDVRIFDPVTQTETIQSQVPLSRIKQIQRSIDGQNLERAREFLERNDQRYDELRAKPIHQRTGQDRIEFRKLSGLPRYHGNKMTALREPAEQELQLLTSGAKQSAQIMADSLRDVPAGQKSSRIEEMKGEIEATDTAIDQSRAALRRIYTHGLGGEMAWMKMARRVTIEGNDLAKFRYVVTPEGTMPVAQDGIKGEIPAGASYSELARGRNVYGAGELVFQRDDATGKWRLREINNASSQYPVQANGTLEYVRNLVQQTGIDTSDTVLFDARQRGIDLGDEHLIGPTRPMGQ